MATCTKEEKVQIIKWYFGGTSTEAIVELFKKNFENKSVTQDSIFRIIKKFENCGCTSDCQKCWILNIHTNQETTETEVSVAYFIKSAYLRKILPVATCCRVTYLFIPLLCPGAQWRASVVLTLRLEICIYIGILNDTSGVAPGND